MKTYVFHDPLRNWVKLGRSHDPERRMRALESASGATLTLVASIDGDCEAALHRACSAARLHGEWFDITDEVREVVRGFFGCEIPDVHPPAIQFFEDEWGIDLHPPDFAWFAELDRGLVDSGLPESHPDVLAVLRLFAEWDDRIAAVGGDLDTRLGMVIVDRPMTIGFQRCLRQAFWAIDGHTPFDVGIASSPPAVWQDWIEEAA